MKSSIFDLKGADLPVIILPMHHQDIEDVAEIHSQQFPRQKESMQWVSCNFAAYPRIMLFVARDEKDKVIGYVQWIHKSGFRNEAIIELEQIAVIQDCQSEGVGTSLIEESLKDIKSYLEDANSTLKAVLVTTRTDNAAQKLYKKCLNAEVVAIIKDLYSSDEAIMVARN